MWASDVERSKRRTELKDTDKIIHRFLKAFCVFLILGGSISAGILYVIILGDQELYPSLMPMVVSCFVIGPATGLLLLPFCRFISNLSCYGLKQGIANTLNGQSDGDFEQKKDTASPQI